MMTPDNGLYGPQRFVLYDNQELLMRQLARG